MYPALLRDELFPVRLGPYYSELRADRIYDMARECGVIARVKVRTECGEYPLRRPDRTVYPVGEFVTTLAGPDILALEKEHGILRVYECATYTLGRPFHGAMSALLRARARAVDEGDKDSHALSKLVANSLAGKLSQRQGGWSRRALLDEDCRWGEYFELDARTGAQRRFRWLCGAAYEWDQERSPRGPHTAAFAYLTAYGRQMMRRIRDGLPERSVVSQDTDGLYLLSAGLRSLTSAGMLAREGPGALRVTASADSARFYGPRHYSFGSRWTLAGFSEPIVDTETMTVSYTTRERLAGRKDRSAPTDVHRIRHCTVLPAELQNGRVQEDGWILPPRILRGRPLDQE